MSEPCALTDADRRALLALARRTIAAHLDRQPASPPATEPTTVLQAPRAAFVTLRRHGDLRGCIGTVQADRPLHQVVAEMAIAAATQDPRFPPVTRAELDGLAIEISVLTPNERIASPADIEIGRHGVAIRLHGRRGLLLPQVAEEQGWSATTLVAEVARKAGLPPEAWRDPAAVLERFAADVFSERALG